MRSARSPTVGAPTTGEAAGTGETALWGVAVLACGVRLSSGVELGAGVGVGASSASRPHAARAMAQVDSVTTARVARPVRRFQITRYLAVEGGGGGQANRCIS